MPSTWTTRDGRKIAIIAMETSHLRNTVAMLRRKGALTPQEWDEEAHALMFGLRPRGDMACLAVEQEVDYFFNHAKVSKHLPELEAELARREVTP